MLIRKCLVNFQLHEYSNKFPILREMKEETYISLECKILYQSEVVKD